MKLAVVLVHGIGNSRKNWANQIIPILESCLKSKLTNLLGKEAPTKMDDVVIISRAYWESVFRDGERKLREKFDGFLKPARAGGPWWDRLSKYLWGLFKKFQCGA